jgi:hypothetical protein
MSKEMRRERNRITARESRDRRASYIAHLETEIGRLNERVAQLEIEVTRAGAATYMDGSMLLSPAQMGFFDEV